MGTVFRFIRKAEIASLTSRELYADAVAIVEKLNVDLVQRLSSISGPKPQFAASIDGQGFYLITNGNITQNYLTVIQTILKENGLDNKYNVLFNPKESVLPKVVKTLYENLLECCAKRTERKPEIPEKFVCPILGQIMTTPVQLPNGTIVERSGIEIHLRQDPSCPFTRQPLMLDQCETVVALKREITEFVFRCLSSDLVDNINEHVKVGSDIHQKGYFGKLGNPYGSDDQKHDIPNPFTVFQTGRSSVTRSPDGRIISQFREGLEYCPLNYPHPAKTIDALRDLFHFTLSNNQEECHRIIYCYPIEARRFFFELQLRCDLKIGFPDEVPLRPFNRDETFMKEPHSMKITSRLSI